MPTEVILPKVDMDMETGQISRWYAKEGDSVSKGQLLFEIETDKAAMEVDAPASGILRGVTAQEGTVVPVGQSVAWIYAEGEDYAAATPEAIEAAPVSDVMKVAEPSPSPVVAESLSVAATQGDAVRATPLARRIARESGIDLASVSGSGPKGRIQRKDVEASAAHAQPAIAKPVAAKADKAPLHAVWLRQGNDTGLAPLVLIHGFGSDLNSWRPMLAGTTLDSAILAIDLPGHGESTRDIPADIDSIAALVEQTIAAHHTGPVVVAAHSFGAAIAAKVAARGNLDIRALTLIAPAGLGPEINGAFLQGFVRARAEPSLLAWMKLLVQDESLLTRSFVKATLAQSQDEGLRNAQKLVADRFFADGTQIFDIRRSLAGLIIPVRVIFGAADRIIPAAHASGLPGEIAVHVFAGTGHMPQLEQREKVVRILREVGASCRQ
ncbi:acetoin dehydrogenase dihydrolipoyllysine-residue acetyltransferase subunit [Phyllobacterium sp. P30BS-XVII]|uniref:acetoin dehydrogenase dihydrolipoyllysine-residue acetyltransferase subunit n=1 Tax=Phyllobacterium sp. P30BS-XVII TaxID=2587046 RepID=UPI0015FE0ED9|nr:acetoin dehydrogenase dihydrolipoyllysine-residue acetyltransferase subunit [Phyllobacterium sp. P30BS-XVII]MBA8900673.1 pyruvate dehydrogenase E2 component (dihydrolipoamide acetyltransferase) [Phyllobacterium sp. P30BS-XVII]